MDSSYEKTSNVDTIENIINDSLPTGNADDQIIRDLQEHGEEVGMTFRTIMAACVSRSISCIPS